MTTEQVGSFRTRPTGDGSLEVWARGWRLESQVYALIPMGLSLMFLLAPMPLAARGFGALVMLLATLAAFRMTKPGLFLARDAVSIVSVVRTQRFPWDAIGGFMGERRHDEGRVLLVLADGRQVPLPGTLDPGELDPYGDEGEALSAVDQLNRLGERARAGDLPSPVVPVGRPTVTASEHPSRKEQRAEKKQLRAALKAVRLEPKRPEGREKVAPDREPSPSRTLRRRLRPERASELTQATIAEPEPKVEPESAPVVGPVKPEPQVPGVPSYYPKPVYIPQAEYAQMLRDQKAAEKAAAAAAAELSELAAHDDLAEKEEFSDWTS
jgi:hypothetical protein